MATVRLWSDAEADADPRVKAVFDDIRALRRSDFINNFWRALANQPALLERTWADLKQVMAADGALDPLTKELIYIAVSTANGCSYCIHSTPPPHAPRHDRGAVRRIAGGDRMANTTNALVTGMQVPVVGSSRCRANHGGERPCERLQRAETVVDACMAPTGLCGNRPIPVPYYGINPTGFVVRLPQRRSVSASWPGTITACQAHVYPHTVHGPSK